jgi:hypothetical protein
MSSVGNLLRRLWAGMHSVCGVIAYRCGCRGAARSHFERVLLLRGDDFRAYIELGRIAFDLGDYATWRREFEHARRLDPNRFARLRHPIELFEPRLAGTSFERGDEPLDGSSMRATWRSLRTPGGGLPGGRLGAEGEGRDPGARYRRGLSDASTGDASSDGLSGDANAGSPGDDGRAETSRPAAAAHDDCRSATERERLRALGPIGVDELRRCNFDELLRKLSG